MASPEGSAPGTSGLLTDSTGRSGRSASLRLARTSWKQTARSPMVPPETTRRCQYLAR